MARSLTRPAILAAAAVLLLLALPRPAAALCAAPMYDGTVPIDEPGVVVFVGTVVDTQSFEQNALLRVDEIWQGGPLLEWQAVFGVREANMMISTATHFDVSQRYLVVGSWDGPTFINRGCRTRQYSPAIAAKAPPNPMAPTPASRPGSWGHPEPWPWDLVLWPLTAAIVIAAGWGALWLRRGGAD